MILIKILDFDSLRWLKSLLAWIQDLTLQAFSKSNCLTIGIVIFMLQSYFLRNELCSLQRTWFSKYLLVIWCSHIAFSMFFGFIIRCNIILILNLWSPSFHHTRRFPWVSRFLLSQVRLIRCRSSWFASHHNIGGVWFMIMLSGYYFVWDLILWSWRKRPMVVLARI